MERERGPRTRGDGDGRCAAVDRGGVGGVDRGPAPVLPAVDEGIAVDDLIGGGEGGDANEGEQYQESKVRPRTCERIHGLRGCDAIPLGG